MFNKQPSRAVLAAMARRAARAHASTVRIKWFIEQVSSTVKLSMASRVRLATLFLRDKIVRNISVPVERRWYYTYEINPNTGRRKRVEHSVVVQRSKPGEYPRVDTTMLMRTIIMDQKESGTGRYEGFVGTPLDYGVILEISQKLNRSYLVRTLNENLDDIKALLTGPLK